MKSDLDILDVVERLGTFHDADKAERIRRKLLRWIEDPLKPKTKGGNPRVNPILVLLAAMALLTTGTFVFFSLLQQ